MKKKKKKKRLNLLLEVPSPRNIIVDSDVDSLSDHFDMKDFEPPSNMSPRSAAKYTKNALKRAAKLRKYKKKKKAGKKMTDDEETTKKKKGKRKRGRKKKKKKRKKKVVGDIISDTEDISREKGLPQDRHFYPTPESLHKKRCTFPSDLNPLVCSICDGIHYRTKRTFKANLKIIINVNKALNKILSDMKGKMKKIDVNLRKVKDNLDQLELLYAGIFKKVNRLIA